MSIRMAVMAGGLVTLVALVVPSNTVGHTAATSSEVTIDFEDLEFSPGGPPDATDSFSGDVSSAKGSCEKGRTVKIFQESPGSGLVGSSTSAANGSWSVDAEDPGDGTYFAKVSKKRSGSGKHKHICKGDRSPDLAVDDGLGSIDNDADSFFVGEDCDDTDPGINPSALETRDGVDQDCSGLADDLDADEDGFLTGDDCDDTDAGRNPDAAEVSDNGIDDDCDGLALTNGSVTDADADGTDATTDCDDTDTTVAPGNFELRDGVDQDCDGRSDNLDEDVDGFLTPEDCDDTDNTTFPSAIETQDGKDEDCDGTSDEDF